MWRESNQICNRFILQPTEITFKQWSNESAEPHKSQAENNNQCYTGQLITNTNRRRKSIRNQGNSLINAFDAINNVDEKLWKWKVWLCLISVSFARRDMTAFLWSMADLSQKQNETKEKAHVCEEFLVERFHWCLNPWNSFVSLIDSVKFSGLFI